MPFFFGLKDALDNFVSCFWQHIFDELKNQKWKECDFLKPPDEKPP